MVAASKIRTQVVKAYNRREHLESALVSIFSRWRSLEEFNMLQAQSNYSLESYADYIRYERQAKHPDLTVTQATYERAIAEAAKRRFNGIEGSEVFLRAFWIGYCDALVCWLLFMGRWLLVDRHSKRILGAEKNVQLSTFRRAIRSVPESGEVWARYIRLLVCINYIYETEPNGCKKEHLSYPGAWAEDLDAVSGIFLFPFSYRSF